MYTKDEWELIFRKTYLSHICYKTDYLFVPKMLISSVLIS